MAYTRNIALCKSVNRIHLEMLTFGQANICPPWLGQVKSPVYSRLYFLSSGSFTVTGMDGHTLTLESGKWYLIPSQYSFDYQCINAMEHFYFHVKLCDYDGTDLLRNCTQPLCLESNLPTDRQFLQACTESSDLANGLALRQMLFQILLRFIQTYQINIHADDYSSCIYRALTYIKQNLSMQLSIEEIAEHVFVSKSTLTKHFRKELSMSVNEYISNTIMEEAERLLMTNNITVHELSQKFGYTDPLYFSRRFKEKFGKSPREYRKDNVL